MLGVHHILTPSSRSPSTSLKNLNPKPCHEPQTPTLTGSKSRGWGVEMGRRRGSAGVGKGAEMMGRCDGREIDVYYIGASRDVDALEGGFDREMGFG